MSKKYRIVIEIEASGKTWYYVQKRFLRLFWMYEIEYRDISMYRYRVVFESFKEANDFIESSKEYLEYIKSTRIKDKIIIYPTPTTNE